MCPCQSQCRHLTNASVGNPVYCIDLGYFTITMHLQTVAALRLLAHHVEHAVDKLGALRVVSLCPVVAGTIVTC